MYLDLAAIITISHPLTVQLWLLCILIFFLGEGEAAKVSKYYCGDDDKMEILENKSVKMIILIMNIGGTNDTYDEDNNDDVSKQLPVSGRSQIRNEPQLKHVPTYTFSLWQS